VDSLAVALAVLSTAGYRCHRFSPVTPSWRCRRAHRAFEIEGAVVLEG
jgi:hypothetical protein